MIYCHHVCLILPQAKFLWSDLEDEVYRWILPYWKEFKEKYRKGYSESSLGRILGEFKPILKVQKGCAMYRDSISCTSYNTGKLILLFLQSNTWLVPGKPFSTWWWVMHALPAGSWQMIAAWKFIITYTVYYKLMSLLELKKSVSNQSCAKFWECRWNLTISGWMQINNHFMYF
jgi:hypothetical protein